uniref:Uncharacterized protein n=1 Tax=Trypanosoma vivax (strain Y486) TaxID=1055687 RepID=G0TVE1_TRYVY|nr:conserved hypothetical protein [Trypanosoma vivax Y486]
MLVGLPADWEVPWRDGLGLGLGGAVPRVSCICQPFCQLYLGSCLITLAAVALRQEVVGTFNHTVNRNSSPIQMFCGMCPTLCMVLTTLSALLTDFFFFF